MKGGPHPLGQQTASGHENTAWQQKRSGKDVYFGLRLQANAYKAEAV